MESVRIVLGNAIGGLVLLFVANAVGLGVQISILTLLLCAALGIPGAILVLLLALFDVAFAASILRWVL